ncbi:5251_t:CDS:2, partial [Funneliformis geosporum]
MYTDEDSDFEIDILNNQSSEYEEEISEKVLNITQIRASIQQKLKFKEIDKEACKFKAVNILLPILNEADNDGYGILDISDSESSDKDDNINQSTGNIQTVND